MVRKAVVLVKQVPDLRTAPVGVRADGTIAREGAAAVTNPVDLHALEAALRLADEVWAVTMGPPRADEVLRDAISRGAKGGVLLTDRLFAGSDTWATANVLAAAIERLGGVELVVCGLSALDGETGQVGPEVAARLGVPQATGCEDLTLDGDRLVARRIVEGGYERLSLPLPAVVTVAETGFTPRYPTLPGRRRAATTEPIRWGAADLGLTAADAGLEASPTKVARMAPAPRPDRTCRFVGDGFGYDDLVAELRAVGALTPSARSAPEPAGDEPEVLEPTTDCPKVWVVGELDDDGELAPSTTELLSKAVELAPKLGSGVAAFVAAAAPERAVTTATRFGADVVYVATHPALTPYRCLPHARVLLDAVRTHDPEVVLFAASTTGRDLAPRVAALLDAGLAADCTDLTVGSWERRGVHCESLLHQIRPAMAGGVLATCVSPTARPQLATVRPGVFAAVARPRRSLVVPVAVDLDPGDLSVEVLDRQVRHSAVGLADADVVVAGGAGCDARSWPMIEALAEAIGGAVAATRGAVEAGLAPRSLQVGQTGSTVHPRLYVACGVSGALQHVVGMHRARTVVAVNRDPDAFIFRVAHFGIVADVADALPALTDALRGAG